MPQNKLDVRPQAKDIDDVWSYILKDNLRAADSIVDRIRKTIDRLVDFPHLGRARPEFGAHVRSFVVGSYTVFYASEPGSVEILRVVHGSRDISSDDLI